ncbi:hypothetical protein CLU79DRAFT_831866 [Phycomyces nitens]|nr:hypothetical protein CLU79DRAFT_831866 [Phycomyces nitens]
MALDFLSSDIVFPSDSNEPKLSASSLKKMPEPVDWALHDYYSTVLEKAHTPIQSLTDLCKLEPVKDELTEKAFYASVGSKALPFFLHENQDEKAIILALASHLKPAAAAALVAATPMLPDPQSDLRAALCGALELVENDMQRNVHDTFLPLQVLDTKQKRDSWNWKNEMLQNKLHSPVNLKQTREIQPWEDSEFVFKTDYHYPQSPSPVFAKIDENPVLLDSSISSALSSAIYEDDFIPPQTVISSSSSASVVFPVTQEPKEEEVLAPIVVQLEPIPEPVAKTAKVNAWKNFVEKVKNITKPKAKETSTKKCLRFFQRRSY